MDKIEFNIPALIDEMRNQTAKNLILHLIESDNEKAVMSYTLDIFRKHGVDVMTAMEILQDLVKAIPQKPEDE